MSKTAQAKTFRAWMLDNLSHDLETIAKHGYDGGVSGLAYYRETSALYDAYQEEIWAIVAEDAEASGNPNILAFIAAIKGAKQVTNEDTFKNFLLWYAVEKEAKAIVKEKEALLERAGR